MNIGSILRRVLGAVSGGKIRTTAAPRRRGSPKAQAAKGIARTVSKKL